MKIKQLYFYLFILTIFKKEVTVSSIRFSDLASTMFVKKELYDVKTTFRRI